MLNRKLLKDLSNSAILQKKGNFIEQNQHIQILRCY